MLEHDEEERAERDGKEISERDQVGVEEERLRALEAARITVSGAVYPGVVVKFGGRVLKVTDALSNAKFTFGRKGRGVTVTSG